MAISNGHNDYSVTEDLATHYNQVRESRDWSWEQLADYFDQQDTDPTSANLASWARDQVKTGKQARGKSTKTETR